MYTIPTSDAYYELRFAKILVEFINEPNIFILNDIMNDIIYKYKNMLTFVFINKKCYNDFYPFIKDFRNFYIFLIESHKQVLDIYNNIISLHNISININSNIDMIKVFKLQDDAWYVIEIIKKMLPVIKDFNSTHYDIELGTENFIITYLFNINY